jgi:hypothetical protein
MCRMLAISSAGAIPSVFAGTFRSLARPAARPRIVVACQERLEVPRTEGATDWTPMASRELATLRGGTIVRRETLEI